MDYKELVAVPAGVISAAAVEVAGLGLGVGATICLGSVIDSSKIIDSPDVRFLIAVSPLFAMGSLMGTETPVSVYGYVHDTIYDWLS
jgi:hypothetical protein